MCIINIIIHTRVRRSKKGEKSVGTDVPAGQHQLLKRFRIDLQKIDEVLIKPARNIVVFLNLACVPQTNLVDKPPQVGNATKESFRAARVDICDHKLIPYTVRNRLINILSFAIDPSANPSR